MKIYIKYIITNFIKLILIVSSIFFLLVLLLNLFEEINFFKDINKNLYYPLLLNILNAPTILITYFHLFFDFNAIFNN